MLSTIISVPIDQQLNRIHVYKNISHLKLIKV